MRGKALDWKGDEEVKTLIEDLADSLAKGSLSYRDFNLKFCSICKTIRAKGLLCNMHRALDPIFDTEKCKLCMSKDIKY